MSKSVSETFKRFSLFQTKLNRIQKGDIQMKKILLLNLMTSLCAFTSLQAYNVYDLSTSFTPLDPNNPFGVWSIGRRSGIGVGDTFVLNTAYLNTWENFGDTDCWWNETNPASPWPGGWPLIYHNFPDGPTGMQTGVNSYDHGVVRWTAPSEGILNIDISIAYVYGSYVAMVMLNNTGDSDPNLWIIYEQPSTSSFTWTGHHIMAGDTIDLVITSPASLESTRANVNEVFTLYAIGEPGAPAENNIPNPNPQTPFDPDDPNAVWDISQQFSATINPGDYWSYGWGAGMNDFHLYDTGTPRTDGNPSWYSSGMDPAEFPQLWKNLGSMIWGVPHNTVAEHPSPTLLAKARWTSVIKDVVACTGSFGAGSTGSVDMFIIKDGARVLLESYNTAVEVPFDVRMAVVPGTTIDFVVGAGADNYYSDDTPLNIQITRSELRCQDLTAHMSADLNQDCYVNLEDFALLAQNWLKCNDPMDPACTDVP